MHQIARACGAATEKRRRNVAKRRGHHDRRLTERVSLIGGSRAGSYGQSAGGFSQCFSASLH